MCARQLQQLGPLQRREQRHAGSRDPELLGTHGTQATAEDGFVIVTDAGDEARLRRQGGGGVEPPSQANLVDRHVHANLRAVRVVPVNAPDGS